jgi:hypothetical protein
MRIRTQGIRINNTGHNCSQLDFFPLLDEESGDGYRPCDPSIIVERVQALEDAYAELVKLAVERR